MINFPLKMSLAVAMERRPPVIKCKDCATPIIFKQVVYRIKKFLVYTNRRQGGLEIDYEALTKYIEETVLNKKIVRWL